jgi:hypothetical protein
MRLPDEIEQFLANNPDYEASPDARRDERLDLLHQMQTGALHPFIIHNCDHETWAVFVETNEIAQFCADYPSAVACTFNANGYVEPKREH